MNKLIALFCLLSSVCLAETNIPAAKSSKLCLVLGNYSSDDNGHPSAMGGIFAARAPANWTYAYSGVDSIHDGTTCFGWNTEINLSTNDVDRCIASNVAMIIYYCPSQNWQYPVSIGGSWDESNWLGLRYASSKGILVLGPHYGNGDWFVDTLRIHCPSSIISVGGGFPDTVATTLSRGPQLEFVDCFDASDIPQSWDNQSTAARLAHIMNDHTNLNSFDVRAYARNTCNNYSYPGWTNNLGYGFINMTNRTGDPEGVSWSDLSSIDAQPPLEAWVATNNSYVYLFWENYLQSGWQSTVVKKSGSIWYEGPGSNITATVHWRFIGTDYPYDTVLNGVRMQRGTFTTNEIEFFTRVNGTLSQPTPYSKITTVSPYPY